MKKLIVILVAGFMSLAVAGAYAADDAKKGDAMKSDTGAAKGDKGAAKSGDKSGDKGMAKSADKAKGGDATAKDDDKKKKKDKDDTKK
jgi:hypothetical protein